MNKHLTGWRFDERSGSVVGPLDDDGDDLVIFKARGDSRGHTYSVLSRSEERQAMVLAAAAPDLVAAVQEALSHCVEPGYLSCIGEPATKRLRAALKKAEPQQ